MREDFDFCRGYPSTLEVEGGRHNSFKEVFRCLQPGECGVGVFFAGYVRFDHEAEAIVDSGDRRCPSTAAVVVSRHRGFGKTR